MAKVEGWDSELFVEPPTENDICTICEGVLRDAVETSCGHSFCDQCIKEWLQQHPTCPIDQQSLALADCRPMVRDRRRILDLKVKCPWCETTMELRLLNDHKRSKCSKRPEDAEDEPEEEKVQEEKVQEEKGEPEYIIELDAGEGGEDQKGNDEKQLAEQRAKEAAERDHLFALQMQEQEKARARGLSQRPGSPSRISQAQGGNQVQLVRPAQVSVGGEPHVDEFVIEPVQQNGYQNGGGGMYYQQDGGGEYGGEYGEGQEGQPVKKKYQPIRGSGCCGCSDKCWCCMCCFFWILLLVLGFAIWFWGVQGAASKVGL